MVLYVKLMIREGLYLINEFKKVYVNLLFFYYYS